ncbi:hypothetical protein [Streptomyces monomycini]|uniref:hypothetical protein n=1 Tax=Streptomyces monomycini TaxID=371720 RepID=UPI0004ABCD76|nr:hypothetical protein [Streptomyces monomycini]
MSLPGADELFRTTGGSGLQSPAPRKPNGVPPGGGETARVPAPGGEPEPGSALGEETTPRQRRAEPDAEGSAVEHGGRGAEADAPKGRRRQDTESAAPQPATGQQAASSRRRGRGANRRPSGRERHDEKITVYVSAEELMDLEHARLVLRGEHGLAVDRGRIVREAVAVVLADLESRGDASILVRRLRGR